MIRLRADQVLLFGVAAGVMVMAGCKKYEEGPAFSLLSKKSRITGEWELVKAPFLTSNIEIFFEFEKDGEFTSTSTFSYGGSNVKSTQEGEWEFSGDKEQVEITLNGNKTEFDILRLKNKEMILEDEDSMEYEFEKQ